MFSFFNKIKKSIKDELAVKHFIKEAKDKVILGNAFYDQYFEKNKNEILRVFTDAADFSKLMHVNEYAAKKLYLANPDLLNHLLKNDDDHGYIAFLNKSSIYSLSGISALDPLLTHMNFAQFMKLNRHTQSNLISARSDLVISLFKSATDVIKFINQEMDCKIDGENRVTAISRGDMASLLRKHPQAILNLFTNANDFIKLSQLDKHSGYHDHISIAKLIVDDYAKNIMPIFKSADDVIQLSKCKNRFIMIYFIRENHAALLTLFNNDVDLYEKFARTNKEACGHLIQYRENALQEEKILKKPHNPTVFGNNTKNPRIVEESVAGTEKRRSIQRQ